ncbi:unnamed protein product [Chilo suppressalis]|uniref:PHD-type domain-containing protein n=1 Tax=Chilo suppressalis TaxID=168631 RepID=A0ABN8B2W7_CHISP|nr:unnamed protein product [Chilo suppressalis]
MAKCNKVKNPCKICLGPVTQKNGLQCQGACESWVHYACLNYTPGRIKDIKAGIIKVTCPCPDCGTSMPKEYRTDEPFSCTNMQCPANKPPQCGNVKCPRNAGTEKMTQSGFGPPCPLGACGNDCKQHSSPMLPNPSNRPCNPNVIPPMPMMSSSDACIDFNKCPSGCSASNVSGDTRRNIPNIGNIGIIPNQGSPVGNMPSLTAMEQMCNTIGLLSHQINDMMVKMRDATSGSCPAKADACPTKGHKSKKVCPKPCYCPGNPAKK